MSQNEFAAVSVMVKQYREAQAQKEIIEKTMNDLKEKITSLMGAHGIDELTGADFTVRYKPYERTTFDSKKFAESHPKLFKAFAKITSYMRFTIV